MTMFIPSPLSHNNSTAAPPKKKLSSSPLAHRLDERIVLDVVGVVGLDLGGDAGEGALEGLLGGGVDHLGLFVSSMLV